MKGSLKPDQLSLKLAHARFEGLHSLKHNFHCIMLVVLRGWHCGHDNGMLESGLRSEQRGGGEEGKRVNMSTPGMSRAQILLRKDWIPGREK